MSTFLDSVPPALAAPRKHSWAAYTFHRARSPPRTKTPSAGGRLPPHLPGRSTPNAGVPEGGDEGQQAVHERDNIEGVEGALREIHAAERHGIIFQPAVESPGRPGEHARTSHIKVVF